MHPPRTAEIDILTRAGVTLGSNYLYPIVDRRQVRQRALDAFRNLKKAE
ncbi:hypothetical protein HF568_18070 [Acidithiobacillus ferridurans]|uniref:Uncharacterized protein n=1 Tax=Acidithiobacillus ferridurans TaxID=1232575 RepID=A0A8X8GEF3_ACIFI|nr:hypothetical protein [Acidithiobacillus ferridurans]MBU2725053.1 hypothetical protein [Acidithiobacillus ferridurans]MBU2725436.1 hypothetical protein [Acidithiobacillus ferridurans]MBU2804049.1 hypothetical protein [Acidithiobacillus ferridurans]